MGEVTPQWWELEDRVVFPVLISPNAIVGTGFVCEVYLAGCDVKDGKKPCARFCHNKELQDINKGKPTSVLSLFESLCSYFQSEAVTELHWLGGEPLLNKKRVDFIYYVSKLVKRYFPHVVIVVFTGYEEGEAVSRFSHLTEVIDFLKVGPFLPNYGIKRVSPTFELASANQKLYKVEGSSFKLFA